MKIQRDAQGAAPPADVPVTTGSRAPRRARRLDAVLDRVAGWQDGRRGLPEVDIPDRRTPRLESIHVAHEAALACVWQEFLRDTAGMRVELEKLTAQRQAVCSTLDEREARLTWLLKRDVRRTRRLGEDALPDDLVQRRREREFERSVSGARKRVQEQLNALRDLDTRLAALNATLAERQFAAAASGRRLHEDFVRRAERYLAAAQRVHPDQAGLVRTVAASRDRVGGSLIPPQMTWFDADEARTVVPDSVPGELSLPLPRTTLPLPRTTTEGTSSALAHFETRHAEAGS